MPLIFLKVRLGYTSGLSCPTLPLLWWTSVHEGRLQKGINGIFLRRSFISRQMAWRAKEPATLRDDERSIEMRADKILSRIRGSMTLDKQSGRTSLGSQACGYHALTFSKQSLKDSKLRFVPLHLQDY